MLPQVKLRDELKQNSMFPVVPVILKVCCYTFQLETEQYTDVSLQLYVFIVKFYKSQ